MNHKGNWNVSSSIERRKLPDKQFNLKWQSIKTFSICVCMCVIYEHKYVGNYNDNDELKEFVSIFRYKFSTDFQMTFRT